ncbi:homocysteine S-methyltransferase YbgG-like [Chelonus insularis]|uniref:homocysteine S-methyltransferase YbgG-like n=1 Tax=Chelonus insularis TaxID=460826 RepID=UPI00158B4EBA|nr:homocysteine S-methyltransferase YbgG-like [Chelonus insularis]
MTKVSVLDGSFSTQVSKHVGKSADGDPLWTARFLVTNPDAVRDTHLDFLRAGSDIIETNTYQASVDGFCKYLNVTKAESLELIQNAVNLAKQAVEIYKKENKDNDDVVNINPQIAGSCGPYGAVLHDASEYTGSYGKSVSKEFLKDWHRVRMETLIKAGVDLLAIETIPCAEEAETLVELLKEFPNTKAWLSFSCSTDGSTIVDGTDFAEIAKKCYNKTSPGQLVAVGVNCLSPQIVSSYLSKINPNKSEKLPLVVYPNSGEVYSPDQGWKDGKHFDVEKCIHEWLGLGVQYIGGCCRTSDEEIAKIRSQVDSWKSQEKETTV